MAILTSTGIRGKVGNVVFQRGRYGEMVRKHVIPKNTNTVAKQIQNQIFAVVSQRYKFLTLPQQMAWITAGAATKTRAKRGTLTGHQYFQKINGTRLTCGLEMTDTPPAPAQFGLLNVKALALTDAGLTLGLKRLTPLPEKLMVFATRASTLGATTARKTRRLLGAFDPASPTLAADIYHAYIAQFEVTPEAGKRVEFTFQQMTSGQVSVPISRIITVTPHPVETTTRATHTLPPPRPRINLHRCARTERIAWRVVPPWRDRDQEPHSALASRPHRCAWVSRPRTHSDRRSPQRRIQRRSPDGPLQTFRQTNYRVGKRARQKNSRPNAPSCPQAPTTQHPSKTNRTAPSFKVQALTQMMSLMTREGFCIEGGVVFIGSVEIRE